MATRQRISDVATRLFLERGFDAVKIEDVAEAADVSRMTVFNHFARKEDLFFDLDEQAREDLLSALQHRAPGTSPIEALRMFLHQAVAGERPYMRFFEAGSEQFMATIQASEALKARVRAIRDELTEMLTAALAEAVQRPLPDSAASLAAALLLATWTVALTEAHRTLQHTREIPQANALLLALIDRGTKAAQFALEGTPYV